MTTAAALRPRTRTALGSPFAQYTDQAPWRARLINNSTTAALRPAVTRMDRVTSAPRPAVIQMEDVTPVVSVRVHGAGKQGAPPRGVPR